MRKKGFCFERNSKVYLIFLKYQLVNITCHKLIFCYRQIVTEPGNLSKDSAPLYKNTERERERGGGGGGERERKTIGVPEWHLFPQF